MCVECSVSFSVITSLSYYSIQHQNGHVLPYMQSIYILRWQKERKKCERAKGCVEFQPVLIRRAGCEALMHLHCKTVCIDSRPPELRCRTMCPEVVKVRVERLFPRRLEFMSCLKPSVAGHFPKLTTWFLCRNLMYILCVRLRTPKGRLSVSDDMERAQVGSH